MRMHLAMACINHQPLKIRVINELFEQSLPNTPVAPTTESAVRVLPVAVTRGQIPPRRPRAQNPKHCIDELPVIFGDAAPLPALTRQMRLKERPSRIR